MATASVTLALNSSTFLAGMARAKASVSSLGSSIGGFAGLAAKGIAVTGAAIIALGTATAFGIKKAFDLGGRLADMSAISGRSVTNILLMRRALVDAGVSMEKIDRYLLTGQDRGGLIEKALKSISAGDWADAAKSIGTQADILDKNAKTFDRVSDLLGRAGDKLQGFFVGAAGAIGKALLPILEKFDKMDFAAQGEKFGAALLKGAQALVGVFENPKVLVQGLEDAFTAAALGFGNTLLAVFKRAGDVFGTILYEAGKRLINPFASGSKSSLMDDVAKSLSGTKLDITDVFGAGAALANAQTQVSRSAALGQSILPTPAAAQPRFMSREEQAAAGQKKLNESQQAAAKAIGNITFAGESGFGNSFESTFAKRDKERSDEFASRWGQPKSSEIGKEDKQSAANALLERIAEKTDKQTDITEKAWGDSE